MPNAAVATVSRSMPASTNMPGVMSTDEKCRSQLIGSVRAITANSNCIVGAFRRSIASSTF